MSFAEPKTRIPIDIKLRRCTRCGHFECTHCRTFCDDGMCLWYDPTNPEHVFAPGKSPCDDASCVYDQPIDAEGYARFDAKADELRAAGHDHLGDQTQDDGTVEICIWDE